MGDPVAATYDETAEHHHLIFADWNRSIDWQAQVFGRLIDEATGLSRARILDCACGIGTQSLGLARNGHAVTGTDLSPAAIARARREAAARGLQIRFEVADMRTLDVLPASGFDVVIAGDNALPHLAGKAELLRAARSIASKLRRGGVFLASIRDYDQLLLERPAVQPPLFTRDGERRRIVHQVWDWTGERDYTFHLYITRETESGWECLHFTGTYHALLRDELTGVLQAAGFPAVRWILPPESGFYQPVVTASLL